MNRLFVVAMLGLLACGTSGTTPAGPGATVVLPKAKPEAALAFDEGVRLLGQSPPNLAEARAAFQRALNLDSKLFEAWHDMGIIDGRLSRWDSAIEQFEAALRIQPASRRTALALAEAFRITQRWDDADKLFARWRKSRPDDEELALLHVDVLSAGGKANDALEIIRGLLAGNSRNGRAFAAMGRVYLKQEKYGLADSALRRGAELAEKEPTVLAHIYSDLGLVLLAQGKDQDAFAALEKAVAADPKAVAARRNRAALFLDCGDYERAFTELEKAAAVAPDDVEIHLALGVAARGRKDFAGARKAYEQALVLRPEYPPALFNLGLLIMDHGNDKKQAREYLLLFRKVAPDRDGGKAKKVAALSRLKELPAEK